MFLHTTSPASRLLSSQHLSKLSLAEQESYQNNENIYSDHQSRSIFCPCQFFLTRLACPGSRAVLDHRRYNNLCPDTSLIVSYCRKTSGSITPGILKVLISCIISSSDFRECTETGLWYLSASRSINSKTSNCLG